jgi:NAD(P)-dependent dehydrogenase (short-subunit alcohol dehydrogenase family)
MQHAAGGHGEGRLAGKRCVVTGAARGIGAQIARTYAAHGATVAVVDVDPAVHALAAALPGGSHAAAVVDVGDPAAVRRILPGVIAELGRIDVLVNNAGILRITPLLDITVEEWDDVFAVNVRSMLVTTQLAASAMIAAGHGGTVVNMASMGAKRATAGQAHYAASKAAVVSLTQAAATELGPHGITVNAICPGYVLTEMGAATRTPEMVAAWSAASPLGRCAEPEDVAAMALFLASDDAAYCTGQAFNINGGMLML